MPAPRWTLLHLPRGAVASRRAWSPRQKQWAAGTGCLGNGQTPSGQQKAIGLNRWHNVLRSGCLKIMESASQPELSSGRRLVVIDKLPGCTYRLLLPLAEPGSASAVEPEFNSATVHPRFVGTVLPEPAGPGVAVCLLGGLLGFKAGLEEGPAGCRSGRSAGGLALYPRSGPRNSDENPLS